MFDIPLTLYFFTNEHPLKTSNKRTHIPLVINRLFYLKCGTHLTFNAIRVPKKNVLTFC